jgi:4-amino-4-deoxy-L-arabinose transferase-like glycosyltransferase
MWRYACYDFSEGMQMGLLILAVYGVVRGSPKAIACAGVGFGALFLVKLVFVAFFPLFLLYLFIRPENLRHRIRNAALFTFPVLLADCFLAWMNAVRFGNPLESGYGNEGHQFFPFQLWHTIPQLLGSLDKGLFIFCPILLLGIFGWKEFALRYRPEAILCGGLLLGNLVLMGGMVRVGRGLVLGATISSSVDSTMAAAGRILVSGAAVATAVLAFCSIDGALDHSPDTGHSSERPGNSSNQI